MQRILTYILIKIVDIGSMRRLNTNAFNVVGMKSSHYIPQKLSAAIAQPLHKEKQLTA